MGIGLGKQFIAAGARVMWSVPFPGLGNLERVVNGEFDPLYFSIASAIFAVVPGTDKIIVRLPWEFNLTDQTNAAKDKAGNWNGTLFIVAWSRVSLIFRTVMKGRETIVWCPAVCTNNYDPLKCLPSTYHYDVIGQDFYMGPSVGNRPGQFSYFRNEQRGLEWGAALSREKGKLFGLSE